MSAVQVEQNTFEMPPREGITIAFFLTVADKERSARWYEKVLGARILTMGDGNAPPYLQLANIWMILNLGGGPTADKPTVTLSTPDPNHINSFMNFRVADIQACYELWKSRGAEFQVRRDSLLPPRPGRLHHRSGAEHHQKIRLARGAPQIADPNLPNASRERKPRYQPATQQIFTTYL